MNSPKWFATSNVAKEVKMKEKTIVEITMKLVTFVYDALSGKFFQMNMKRNIFGSNDKDTENIIIVNVI